MRAYSVSPRFTFSSIGQELDGCWLGVGVVVWGLLLALFFVCRFLAFHFVRVV